MKNLAIIFGGASVEHDVSIITGLQAIDKLKDEYKIYPIYLTLDNDFYLVKCKEPKDFLDKEEVKKKSQEIVFCKSGFYIYKSKKMSKFVSLDFVLNCCHGGVGEKGDLYAYLKMNNLKVSSTDNLSAGITMDKYLTKLVAEREGVPVVKGCLITKNNVDEKIKEIKKDFGDNLIIKPNSLGSSIGVIKTNKKALKESVDTVLHLDERVLVEECVGDLIEFNCAVVKNHNELLLSEIEKVGTNDVLSYENKYYEGKSSREIPAKIDAKLKQEIYNYTKKIYSSLNMSGVARVDYLFDTSNEKLYFNEINSVPGSLAYYLFEGLGIDYIMLVNIMLDSIKEEKKQTYFESDILTKTGFRIK